MSVQEDTEVILAPTDFSPYAGRDVPQRPLWGDSHLHTMVSVDAGTMTRLTQEQAFRFARGEEVTTTHGLRPRLSRPLDWLVVSDHAEMYGLMPQLLAGDDTRSRLPADAGYRKGVPMGGNLGAAPDGKAPRWTAYEAKRFGIEMHPEVPMITTERAYTSPIWHTPKG